MNRRSFMKNLFGSMVGAAALLAPSKAEEPKYSYDPARKTVGIDPNSQWAKQCLSDQVIFHNRKVFIAGERRVVWTETNNIHSWQVAHYIDLPTYDTLHCLRLTAEGRLFFYGSHGLVCELLYIGGIAVFGVRFHSGIRYKWCKWDGTGAIAE